MYYLARRRNALRLNFINRCKAETLLSSPLFVASAFHHPRPSLPFSLSPRPRLSPITSVPLACQHPFYQPFSSPLFPFGLDTHHLRCSAMPTPSPCSPPRTPSPRPPPSPTTSSSQFQTLCESSRLYEPGSQYMEFVKRLGPSPGPDQPESPFSFQPYRPGAPSLSPHHDPAANGAVPHHDDLPGEWLRGVC